MRLKSSSQFLKLFLFSLIYLQFFTFSFAQKDWTIVNSYEIPGKASGLAYDGAYLYFGIYGSNGDQVYRFDPVAGTADLLFESSVIEDSYGMTCDGVHLWVTDHAGSSSDPAYAMEFDLDGNLLSQFDLPDHYMSGIAYDNGDFWVSTYYPDPGTIYKVDASGNILSQFISPGDQPWDICTQVQDLWIVNEFEPYLIYKVDNSGSILESHETANIKPAGIVYDGQYLWYVDGPNSSNSTLYKVDLGGSGTPEIDIPVDSYNYGNVTIGEEASWECVINNNGDGLLTVNNLVIQNAVPIFNNDTFPMEISPGESSVITLTYIPQDPIELNTIVTVQSNDPIHPEIELELTGYGVISGPTIDIPITNYNYGEIRRGATERWNLQVNNLGDEILTVTNLDFSDSHFYLESNIDLPVDILPNDFTLLGVWFFPDQAQSYNSSLMISSNDSQNPQVNISLTGSAIEIEYPIGDIFWTLNINSGFDNSIKAIGSCDDVNNDGVEDVIICDEDNFIRCINGNAFGTGEILWENEAGSIYAQNDLDMIEDINNDGIRDVVVGLAWGVRAIKVLSGIDGETLWTFDTHIYGDGGWVYQVNAHLDFNDDGVKDVLAATGDDSGDTGPRRIFCLNGLNGEIIWESFTGGPNFSVIAVNDFTGDDKNDVIAGASNNIETEGRVYGINGFNGNIEWTITTEGSTVWALETLDDINSDDIDDLIAGDTYGNLLLIDPVNGSILESGGVGSATLLRFEKLDDVNSDGISDIAVASSSTNAVTVDGTNGDNVWLNPLSDMCWNIDKISDISGDGINDLIVGTLFQDNQYYFLNATNGETLFSSNFSEPIDAIGAIPDINGDGSMEMIVGGREGNIRCVSGGLNSAALMADFTADITEGSVPLTVNFSDLSVGEINEWEWDFQNDGMVDSYEQNPTFIYETPGLYDVKLSVSDGQNSHEIIKEDYIDALLDNITTNSLIDGYLIYPIPFSEILIIEITEDIEDDFQIDILSMNGMIVKQFNRSHLEGDRIVWSGISDGGVNVKDGNYLIRLQNNNRILYQKVLLHRN